MAESGELYIMFIESAKTWVVELENNLLDLEKFPRDKELLNNIFRIVHNIKGSSGNVGLTDISGFAHTLEDSLELMRQDKLFPDKQLISSLLTAVDLISEMVEAAAVKDSFDLSRCSLWVCSMDTLKVRSTAI